MDNIISKKLNSLEHKITETVAIWKKNQKQKERLLQELAMYKKRLQEEVGREKEVLRSRLKHLQREREEIKHRIKILLKEISLEDEKFLQPEDS